jgi:hypothetical protein
LSIGNRPNFTFNDDHFRADSKAVRCSYRRLLSVFSGEDLWITIKGPFGSTDRRFAAPDFPTTAVAARFGFAVTSAGKPPPFRDVRPAIHDIASWIESWAALGLRMAASLAKLISSLEKS